MVIPEINCEIDSKFKWTQIKNLRLYLKRLSGFNTNNLSTGIIV